MIDTDATAVELVQQFYTHHAEGRHDAAFAMLAPDVLISEPPSLPWGGLYRGVDGYHELVARCEELTEMELFSLEVIGSGHIAVAIMSGRITNRATGASIDMVNLDKVTVEGGLFVEMQYYYQDPAAVSALFL